MELTRLDYYAALDLTPAATPEQVAGAYKFAVDSYAPESLAAYGLLAEDERAGILSFLREAYRTLSDESLRREYDRRLVESGKYGPEQMAHGPAAAAPAAAPPAALDAPAVAAPAKPALEQVEPPAVQARERAWWPFTEKPRSEPKPAPEPPAAPQPAVNLPALDGRPLGGEELRQIREARGLRLDEVSQQTKISLTNLRFMEEGKFEFLPAAVYMKGFLRTYAKVLRIDADKLVRDYMAVFEAHRQA